MTGTGGQLSVNSGDLIGQNDQANDPMMGGDTMQTTQTQDDEVATPEEVIWLLFVGVHSAFCSSFFWGERKVFDPININITMIISCFYKSIRLTIDLFLKFPEVFDNGYLNKVL